MNERSLIGLTALALLTGILLLGAGHFMFDYVFITSPQPMVLEIPDAQDQAESFVADSEVQPTYYEELTVGAIANVDASKKEVGQGPGTASWTAADDVSEPTLRAPELTAADQTNESIDDPAKQSVGDHGSDDASETPRLPDDFQYASDESSVGQTSMEPRQFDGVPYEMVTDSAVTLSSRDNSDPMFPASASNAASQSMVGSPSGSMASPPVISPIVPLKGFPPQMPRQPLAPRSVQPDSINTPALSHANPMRLGPGASRVAQVPPTMNPALAPANQPPRIPTPNDQASANDSNSGKKSDAEPASLKNEKTKLGKAPEKTTNELQFLRRQSILLEPGQYQFDVTLQYLINESDFPVAQLNGNLLQIGESQRKQRLLLLPIEFRLGLTPVTQVFVNVPFGWSNGEISSFGVDEFDNSGGLGDISAGMTRMLIKGNDHFPDVLGVLAFSVPTGNSNFVTSLSTPGNALGQGFWTLTAGVNFIQTYDPIVIFYGLGYRHRFESNFDVNIGSGHITVNPGKQIFYRFGAGFAVNPRVTLSASFIGSYITEDKIDGVRLAGSIREPISVRLAATISKNKELKKNQRIKMLEPFVNFGVTDAAANTLFGVSYTH